MDTTPEEIGFAGVVGIFTEAVKLLRSYSRHFLSMAGTLVLPLGIFLFSHRFATDPVLHKLSKMGHNNHLDAEFVGLYVVAVLYILLALALSLFATAAIIYSVACIYTGKGLSYTKVMSVVPKLWSRLMNTFFWAHTLLSFYYAGFIVLLLGLLFLQATTGVSMTVLVIPSALVFNFFLVHFNLVWHLASAVSVLEDTKGVSAMKRGNTLIQGKRLVGFCLFCIYAACMVGMVGLFRELGKTSRQWRRVCLGGLLLVAWTAVTFVAIVIQSIFYFVCKAYHQESIDRSALAEKLDGYLGEYVLLREPGSLGALDAELEDV